MVYYFLMLALDVFNAIAYFIFIHSFIYDNCVIRRCIYYIWIQSSLPLSIITGDTTQERRMLKFKEKNGQNSISLRKYVYAHYHNLSTDELDYKRIDLLDSSCYSNNQ